MSAERVILSENIRFLFSISSFSVIIPRILLHPASPSSLQTIVCNLLKSAPNSASLKREAGILPNPEIDQYSLVASQTRAVESDFEKSNKSRMPIFRFSNFIRLFNR